MNAGRRRQMAVEALVEALRLLDRSLSSASAAEMRGYAEQARAQVEEALQLLRGGW
jgi:hypothetical protein